MRETSGDYLQDGERIRVIRMGTWELHRSPSRSVWVHDSEKQHEELADQHEIASKLRWMRKP